MKNKAFKKQISKTERSRNGRRNREERITLKTDKETTQSVCLHQNKKITLEKKFLNSKKKMKVIFRLVKITHLKFQCLDLRRFKFNISSKNISKFYF